MQSRPPANRRSPSPPAATARVSPSMPQCLDRTAARVGVPQRQLRSVIPWQIGGGGCNGSIGDDGCGGSHLRQ
jgi:hypothetical protein